MPQAKGMIINMIENIKKVYWNLYERRLKLLSTVSPTYATKYLYKNSFGRKLDLNNPLTFNEKLQWLKLNTYYNAQLVTMCADKYRVREYVEKCGCGEILNDLIGVYDSFEEIPWNFLPQKFALKCNHGCGYNLICDNKEELDYSTVKKTVDGWMSEDYWKKRAEINYKFIKKKIIIEKFIETEFEVLPDDYKFFCFDGIAEYVMVCLGREGGHAKYYFFNRKWEMLPYSQEALDAPKNFSVKKPDGIEKAFDYAEILSKGFPFVRTDLYCIDNKITFGELTFTPAAALDKDLFPSFDRLLGDKLNLGMHGKDK